MGKLLSISIAAYNVEKTIKECLDSFLPCRHLRDLEILVIDDGSQDRTADIVFGYEQKFPDVIHLVNKENGGHGSTINASLALATGVFYKVIDGDDWVDPIELDKLCDCLEKTEADLVVNDYQEVYPDHKRRISHRSDYEMGKVYPFEEICPKRDFDRHIFAMHESTVRTKRLREAGMKIQEKCFYADTEFIFYVGLAARTVQFHDSCAYQYRLGSAGQSVSPEGIYRHIEDLIQIELNLMRIYNEQVVRLTGVVRKGYLFAIIDTRYTMLLHCFSAVIQRSDKDILLVRFLKEASEKYPEMVKKMHLSRLHRYIVTSPGNRIEQVRRFRKTSIFKVLCFVKHLGDTGSRR